MDSIISLVTASVFNSIKADGNCICRVFHLRTTILPAEEDMPAIMASFKKFNDDFMEQYEDYGGYLRM